MGIPREDWTSAEVDVLVGAYFSMWIDWLSGEQLNKAARVRELRAVLPARTRGAIEYKLQNLSTVVDDRLDVWLQGYRPASNYQRELEQAADAWLARDARLRALLERHRRNTQPASLPETPATEDLLVTGRSRGHAVPGRGGLNAGTRTAIDDFRLKELGTNGEEFVWRVERESLRRAGRADLAGAVEWTARDRGDGLGYDVASYRPDGRRLHIEVKTTNFGLATPFCITRNEVDFSKRDSENYALYRVFDFGRMPGIYRHDGDVERLTELRPYVYVGSIP